ncbi:MAG: ABC transporter substrate-binding protein [Dehalococcoidia bacterium]|nr:ABC transporter substrate-binding protein [Dehalococcoidia bacterium]
MERKKLLTLIGSVCLIIVLSALPFMTACPAPPPPPPAEEEELPPPPPPPPAKEKIVIGNVDAFTGVFAPGPLLWGTIWMETLIADYNANGGLYVPEYGKKLPIELIKYDSTSDTETLIRLTEKCMTEDKVDLMFAPWGTSQNFAVYSLYEKYKYPMIPHAMGSGQIVDLIKSGAAKWAFPVLCQPPFVAEYVADFFQWANASKIGIIGISDLHGIEFTGQVKAQLSQRGMSVVVGPELYPLTVSDLSPIIKKLKEANVDTLWASTYPADGTLLVKQCMDLGYSPRIMIMGPGSQYPLIMVPAFGLEAVKGIMEYHGFEVDFNSSPELLALAEKYKEAAGGSPGANTIAAYVCHEVLFKAVEKYGLDREKIRDALATETFDTVLGPAKWNWEKVYLDVPGAGYLCQWQGKEIMQVVWPLDRASAEWIPKPQWP